MESESGTDIELAFRSVCKAASELPGLDKY